MLVYGLVNKELKYKNVINVNKYGFTEKKVLDKTWILYFPSNALVMVYINGKGFCKDLITHDITILK